MVEMPATNPLDSPKNTTASSQTFDSILEKEAGSSNARITISTLPITPSSDRFLQAMKTRLSKSCGLCLLLLNPCAAVLQEGVFNIAKKHPVAKAGKFNQEPKLPKYAILTSTSDSTRAAPIDRQTTKPTNDENRDLNSIKSSPNTLREPHTSSQLPRDRRKLLETWSDGLQPFKSHLKTLKTGYQNFLSSAKDFLNLFEKYKQVAVFSENDHLQEIFGETYEYYKTLQLTEQRRFWEVFEKEGNAEARGLSPRLTRTSTFGQDGKRKAAVLTEAKVRHSRKMVFWGMKIVARIEESKGEYNRALEQSMNLVRDFVRKHSNDEEVSDVSRRIRNWKKMHPSEMPPLKHPYQAAFIDIFGPGNLAKPELGDLSEKERFQKLWQVNTEQMNAILKVSSEAKSILVDLFAANERNIQRGFWRYVGSSKRHRKETEEAAQRQDLVHKQLLATFASEEELVAKMKTIASLRITDEEWADRRFAREHYDILPFVDPLRAGRRHEDHPDITPMLRDFGLHTTPRTAAELMKLSDALVPLLRAQYKQQITARVFREALEASFDGATQYRILLLLPRVVQVMKSSPTHPRPLHSFLFDTAKEYLSRLFKNIKLKRYSTFKPQRFPSFRTDWSFSKSFSKSFPRSFSKSSPSPPP
ncbi:hypothetical protein PCANC_08577 [Puccinia coronata f. sp. avenae]|uniref:Uncharacterized protein n=1 Tax=Puccinia coronata f. sp. avenae TaxID=200324 RepID=A0A2N5V240_9BASI|nr:hypothetical protein PCANC_08577 [Puccinia coronata f. sp. avenae]